MGYISIVVIMNIYVNTISTFIHNHLYYTDECEKIVISVCMCSCSIVLYVWMRAHEKGNGLDLFVVIDKDIWISIQHIIIPLDIWYQWFIHINNNFPSIPITKLVSFHIPVHPIWLFSSFDATRNCVLSHKTDQVVESFAFFELWMLGDILWIHSIIVKSMWCNLKLRNYSIWM